MFSQGSVENIQATIDSALDSDGNTHEFESPWTITLSKSQVNIVYPLTYLQV